MARSALAWTTADLAKRARVGANTVRRFENGKPVNVSSLTLIRQALEEAGVVFLNGDGVRLHPRKE